MAVPQPPPYSPYLDNEPLDDNDDEQKRINEASTVDKAIRAGEIVYDKLTRVRKNYDVKKYLLKNNNDLPNIKNINALFNYLASESAQLDVTVRLLHIVEELIPDLNNLIQYRHDQIIGIKSREGFGLKLVIFYPQILRYY